MVEEALATILFRKSPLAARALPLVAPLFASGGFASVSERPMLAFSADGYLLGLNAGGHHLLQIGERDWRGTRLEEYIPSQYYAEAEQRIAEFVSGKRTPTTHVHRYDVFGTLRHVEWRNTPLFDTDGEFVAIVSEGRDISEQRSAEKLRDLLFDISTAANFPVDLDDILLKARNAIIEVGDFDRAGIWLIEGEMIQGVWGTDEEGGLRDEHYMRYHFTTAFPYLAERLLQNEHYLGYPEKDHPNIAPIDIPANTDVPTLVVGLRSQNQLIGAISMDNRLTGRPITTNAIQCILPLCEQVAIAITLTRTQQSHANTISRSQRLLDTVHALHACKGLDNALRLLRNTIVEGGMFERAGIYSLRGNRLVGAWGTDLCGKERSEHGLIMSPFNSRSIMAMGFSPAPNYKIWEDDTWREITPPPTHFKAPWKKAIIRINTGQELLGAIFVDNLITNRPLLENEVAELAQFIEQVAIAIKNIALLEEQSRIAERQQRLTAIAAVMSETLEPDAVLRMIRDAVVDVGGFDRAGIWVLDNRTETLLERWGTRRDGTPQNEDLATLRLAEMPEQGLLKLLRSQDEYLLHDDYASAVGFPPEHPMYGVHAHAAIPLRIAGETVGVVTVDNLLTDAPITEADIATLQPFVQQAAVALRQSRLLQERARSLEVQKAMSEILTSINAGRPLEETMGLLYAAVQNTLRFDRVGIFVYDAVRGLLRGVWGTQRDGSRKDLSDYIERLDKFYWQGLQGQDLFLEENYAEANNLAPDDIMAGVRHHASIIMRAGEEIAGVLCVDNLFSGVPITYETAKELIPFANQGAVAVRDAHHREQRIRETLRERRIAEIIASNNANVSLRETLSLVYEATLEMGLFDRVGIFTINLKRQKMQGVWGTNRKGKKTDMSHLSFPLRTLADIELTPNTWHTQGYVIHENYTERFGVSPDEKEMYGIRAHCSIVLKAQEETVGLLAVDNAFHDTPITHEQVQFLIPLAEQVALAIQSRQIQEERNRYLQRQSHLTQIIASVGANTSLSDTLRLVRDAVIGAGGFDRAGVSVLNPRRKLLMGAWGTDRNGGLEDISSYVTDYSSQQNSEMKPHDYAYMMALIDGSANYHIIENYAEEFEIEGDHPMTGVENHAMIAIRAGEEVAGILTIDNLFRKEPITEEDINALLPFVNQAAIAIQNVRLREEREQAIQTQLHLDRLAASINQNMAVPDILSLARDAATLVAGFDRAAIYLIDPKKRIAYCETTDNGKQEYDSFSIDRCALHGTAGVYDGTLPYFITQDFTEAFQITPDNFMYGVRAHAMVALQSSDRVEGVLFVDNATSNRPIDAEDIAPLLPFTHQTAAAIRSARLQDEREKYLLRQTHLDRLAASINSQMALRDVLRLVRDAAVEAGGFDRVGVFLADMKSRVIQGTWGTDRHGDIEDISNERYSLDTLQNLALRDVIESGNEYAIVQDYEAQYDMRDSPHMHGVHAHASVALTAPDGIIGLLCLDNLISNRPIDEGDVQAILPIAYQAALAIQNARLLEERAGYIRRQARLSELASAISSNYSLNAILLMLRDALVDEAGFDRAGIWLYDERMREWKGAWGTGAQRQREDISDFPITRDFWREVGLEDVALGRIPYRISHGSASPQDQALANQGAPRAHAGVCMKTQEGPVGFIALDNLLSNRPIQEEDIALILPFAEQAAVAIRNARLLEEREASLLRQRRLAEFAADISSNTLLNVVTRKLRNAVVEVAGFERAGLFLLDPETNEFVGTWGTDRLGKEEWIASRHIKVDETAWNAGIQRYEFIEDYTQTFNIAPDHRMYGVKNHARVSIVAGDDLVGILCVDNALTNRPILPEDLEGLIPFANQMAVAIQNARLFANLQEAQEALLRSERLRAVGELASGVAHNVNNVLAAVLGYAELLHDVPQLPPEAVHYVETIERAAMDGADIVRRVQRFARKETQADRTRLDLGALSQEAITLTRPMWHHQAASHGTPIELVSDIAPKVFVMGIASEIREALVNLIRNAVDAMPSGGTIRVECSVQNRKARVAVSDTGVGMNEQTLSRIFQPFFTTKGVTLGTGLGLSITWGILERHGGTIRAESIPNQGSTFIITLPLADDALPEETVVRSEVRLDGLRILLVEDETVVAQSLTTGLEKRGAKVVALANALLAQERLEAEAHAFDLILTDHGLTGMTGLELLNLARQRYPHIHRLLLSGWGANVPDAGDTTAAERLLSKPILVETLATSIREIMALSPSAQSPQGRD